MDLEQRVAATVAQFFGENDSPEDVARAIIPIVMEEAAKRVDALRTPNDDPEVRQMIERASQALRSYIGDGVRP